MCSEQAVIFGKYITAEKDLVCNVVKVDTSAWMLDQVLLVVVDASPAREAFITLLNWSVNVMAKEKTYFLYLCFPITTSLACSHLAHFGR